MCIACQVLRQELPVGGALRKSHGPQYAGVRKLRALCVSVIFAEHSFRENPRKYACSKRSEIDSTIAMRTLVLPHKHLIHVLYVGNFMSTPEGTSDALHVSLLWVVEVIETITVFTESLT